MEKILNSLKEFKKNNNTNIQELIEDTYQKHKICTICSHIYVFFMVLFLIIIIVMHNTIYPLLNKAKYKIENYIYN